MASNFEILIHRYSDNLHLKLLGDFDDSSAQQLVNAVKKHGDGAVRVFIHTSGLNDVYSFARDTFYQDIHLLKRQFSGNLIFSGEHAIKIAPNNSWII